MPFNNMRTLKFIIQPIVMLFAAVNHCSGPLRKQKGLAQWGQNITFVCCNWWISIHFVIFCIFVVSQLSQTVIMIDNSKTRKSLARFEVQSPYVIERCSKANNNILH